MLLLKTAGNTVSDNHIHHCGFVYKHIGGVILEGEGTDDNLVAHNLIHDISRYGISLKNAGLRNRIEYNRVLNTSLETCDTGGIEVTQQDRELRSGSVIRNNIVGDSIGYSADGPKPVFMSWGIYLDSFAGGYTVTHNVTYRSSHGGMMLQGGKDNTRREQHLRGQRPEPGVHQQLCQQLDGPDVPAKHRRLHESGRRAVRDRPAGRERDPHRPQPVLPRRRQGAGGPRRCVFRRLAETAASIGTR